MKRAGAFRNKVTVKNVTETVGSYGGITQTWATYAIRMAVIEPLRGREFFNAQQLNSEASLKITFRYDSITAAITSKMQIVFGNHTYLIVAPPINVGMFNQQIECMCKELNG